MKPATLENRNKGLTLIEALAIIVILCILAALILPPLALAKYKTRRIGCINNLKQIGLSFGIFANDHDGKFPMQLSTNNGGSLEFIAGGNAYRHFLALSKELSTPKILICPADKRKALTNFAALNNEHVSYFVGLEAKTNYPGMLLVGDRNITNDGLSYAQNLILTTNQEVGWTREMHHNSGNVVLANGNVQMLGSEDLREALRDSGVATNRLALP